MLGQQWAGGRLTEASVAAGNIQGEEWGKRWLPLGQVPHLVHSVAAQAGILPRRKGQCREQAAGEEVGYDTTAAVRNMEFQA